MCYNSQIIVNFCSVRFPRQQPFLFAAHYLFELFANVSKQFVANRKKFEKENNIYKKKYALILSTTIRSRSHISTKSKNTWLPITLHNSALLCGKKAYSTWYSQAVSHPSTNQARPCLTSEIRRDRACSEWYGRKRITNEVKPFKSFSNATALQTYILGMIVLLGLNAYLINITTHTLNHPSVNCISWKTNWNKPKSILQIQL